MRNRGSGALRGGSPLRGRVRHGGWHVPACCQLWRPTPRCAMHGAAKGERVVYPALGGGPARPPTVLVVDKRCPPPCAGSNVRKGVMPDPGGRAGVVVWMPTARGD